MSYSSERGTFLKTYLQRPLTVGSVIPSAPALVNRMLAPIPWGQIRTVVELGAGTGPMTAEILRRKPAHVKFLAFEREPAFRKFLRGRFPGLPLYPEAFKLSRVLARTGRKQADVIISGIPFGALPVPQQDRLLDEVERSLAPGGLFVAFQYSPMLLGRLRRRFARCEVGLVLLNLPPALVYTCTKAAGSVRCADGPFLHPGHGEPVRVSGAVPQPLSGDCRPADQR